MKVIELKDWVQDAHKTREVATEEFKDYCKEHGYHHATVFVTFEMHAEHIAIEVRAYECCPAVNAGAHREVTYEALNQAPVNVLERNVQFAFRDLKRAVKSNIDSTG